MGNANASKQHDCERLAARLQRKKLLEVEQVFRKLCGTKDAFNAEDLGAKSFVSDANILTCLFDRYLGFCEGGSASVVDWQAFLKICISFEDHPEGFLKGTFTFTDASRIESVLRSSLADFFALLHVDVDSSRDVFSAVHSTIELISAGKVFMTNASSDSDVLTALRKVVPSAYQLLLTVASPTMVTVQPSLPFNLRHTYPVESALLTKERAWLLGDILSASDSWSQVYSSEKQGKAWATFVAAILDKADTVLVARDTAGSLFGAFAPCCWHKSASFYGKDDNGYSSAVFSLWPSTRLYTCSGYNTNFQYLASGCTSGINPNGIGFGGQVNHFAFFVDASLDSGHSYPSATFNNASLLPDLSSKMDFGIDAVEVWCPTSSSSDKEKKKGVLSNDQYNTEKQLLQFAGVYKGHHEQRR